MHLRELRIDEAPAQCRILQLHLAAREGRLWLAEHKRRARHTFHAARDVDRAFATLDGMRSGIDGLQARTTEAVDRLATDFHRQTGKQQRHARDVAVILTSLVGTAKHHILDGLT